MRDILVNSIQANMEVVKYLLNQPQILQREILVKSEWSDTKYFTTNRDNVELRQRIKLLRKELVKLEKEILKDERKWGTVTDEA